MTFQRFRVAVIALVIFNLAGTLVTWVAHLSKPGTSTSHAWLAGTEFTGPLLFIAIWVASTALLWAGDRAATAGTWLMTLFAALFSVGEISELLKSNVGVSSGKWDAISALAVVGLAIGLLAATLGVVTIVRARRVAATP